MAYGSSPVGALQGCLELALGVLDLDRVDVRLLAELGGVRSGSGAGPCPEHEEVRQRVAAEAVGAVHPARDLSRRVEAGQRRRAGLGVHPDAAHHVVRRRPDLHRTLRDVDVGELLELLVHRGQLAPDVVRREVADVEVHAAVRRAASLADLGVDGPGDVVPGRQLRWPASVGLASLRQGRDPAGRLLVGRGVLGAAVLGQVLPHEALAEAVAQDPALRRGRLRSRAGRARRAATPCRSGGTGRTPCR